MKAVVLLNMGGPNNLDEVSLFLKNMFNDENIITTKSKILRKFIAFMITTLRTKKAKENYSLLDGKSPITEYTVKLVRKLQQKCPDIYITFAMRYTPLFSKQVILDLKDKNIKKVLLIPLYPHFSTTTTKSSLEDFIITAKKLYQDLDIQFIQRFYKEELYNKAILQQISQTMKKEKPEKYDLIFSAHSLPQKIIDKGDSYQKEIIDNVNILKQMLQSQNINFNKIHLAYQSKLGPIKWLGPSLEDKLKSIENKNVIIYPLSFIIDNSETEYELDIEYRKISQDLNFDNYKIVKCLNDNNTFITFLEHLIYNKAN